MNSKNYLSNLDFLIKASYLIPAISIVISTLYTLSYWFVLDFEIIDYLTISHLLVSSIRVIVILIICIVISGIFFSLVFGILDYLEKKFDSLIWGYLFLLILNIGSIWFSNNKLKSVIIMLSIFALAFILLWLFSSKIDEKLYSSLDENVDNLDSNDAIDKKYLLKSALSDLSLWLRKTGFILFVLILLLVVPVILGYKSADYVKERVSYSFVYTSNLYESLDYDADKLILLGKIGENYFFQPDTMKTIIIKQISDFKNLEIRKVEKGDSLSSISTID